MKGNIIGVKPPAPKRNTYVDFELTNYNPKDIIAEYEKWKKDDSYIKKYDSYEFMPFGVDLVLVRLFRYEQVNPYLLSPITQEPMVLTKILPFCKVIKATANVSLAPGTILLAPDRIADVVTNIDWLKWKDIVEKERPTIDIPEPPKFSGLLQEWRNSSEFALDKFITSADDGYTFIRPLSEFKMTIK
jgi:hypothetical protein